MSLASLETLKKITKNKDEHPVPFRRSGIRARIDPRACVTRRRPITRCHRHVVRHRLSLATT